LANTNYRLQTEVALFVEKPRDACINIAQQVVSDSWAFLYTDSSFARSKYATASNCLQRVQVNTQ